MGDPACYLEVRSPNGKVERFVKYPKEGEGNQTRWADKPAPFDFKTTFVVVANDNLSEVVSTLESIRSQARSDDEVLLVDNGCDQSTRNVLRSNEVKMLFTSKIIILDHVGWLKAIDAAFDAACGDVIVVVSPGVKIFDGFVDRIGRCISRANVGMVVPVSTKQVPPLSGLSTRATAEIVASENLCPEVCPTPGSFCFAVDPDVFKSVGGWDLRFSPGHGAMLDLVFRMWMMNMNVICARDVLVHDGTPGVVTPEAGESGSKLLAKKHGRKCVAAGEIYNPGPSVASAAGWSKGREKIIGQRPRFVWVFNEVFLCGASLLAAAVSNWMCRNAMESTIYCTRFDVGQQNLIPMDFAPEVFGSRGERDIAISNLPPGSVVVAPLFTTVQSVADACDGRPLVPIYYVQDDEAMFVTKDGEPYAEREAVEESYSLIENVIANSEWVAAHVGKIIGREVPVVCPGVDTLMFRPPLERGEATVRILAHSRPSTPRRGWTFIERVMRRVLQHRRVEFYTYDEDPGFNHPSHFHLGKVSPAELSVYMRGCHIFLEGSEVQGFGMQALEAMASGMALVCTDNRGIDTFGESKRNCVIVPQHDPEVATAVICTLVDDAATRENLGEVAAEDAKPFDWRWIGFDWNEHIERMMG